MNYLTTAPVESRSLAICGIEGVNVSIIESIHNNKKEGKRQAKFRIDIQCITIHPDTTASMIFFLVDENRR